MQQSQGNIVEFRTHAELMAAINDTRYKNNPAYRAEIIARLERTPRFLDSSKRPWYDNPKEAKDCPMNKPHVDKLHYRMVIPETVTFDNARPVTSDTDAFTMTASKDGVVFTMKDGYQNESAAKTITEEYLQKWKMICGVQTSPGTIEFEYDYWTDINGEKKKSVISSCTIAWKIYNSYDHYPAPPSTFMITPDVQTMYDRYQAYRQGKDRLLSMAYLIVTILIMDTGTVGDSADKFKIANKVIKKLKRFCASGDRSQARKVHKGSDFKALTNKEVQWVESSCKQIIERVGLIEGGTPDLPQITMDDLPPLS